MDNCVYISAINQVCLRVRDTRRSGDFYRTLFGLEEALGQSDPSDTCVLRSSNGSDGCQLTLVEGLPPGDHLIGLDYFSFEVRSSQDVQAVYQKAASCGCRVTKPRVADGRWQLFVFDPDGYKLAVTSPCPDSARGLQDEVSRQAS